MSENRPAPPGQLPAGKYRRAGTAPALRAALEVA